MPGRRACVARRQKIAAPSWLRAPHSGQYLKLIFTAHFPVKGGHQARDGPAGRGTAARPAGPQASRREDAIASAAGAGDAAVHRCARSRCRPLRLPAVRGSLRAISWSATPARRRGRCRAAATRTGDAAGLVAGRRCGAAGVTGTSTSAGVARETPPGAASGAPNLPAFLEQMQCYALGPDSHGEPAGPVPDRRLRCPASYCGHPVIAFLCTLQRENHHWMQ
jgi:hypothetical protein